MSFVHSPVFNAITAAANYLERNTHTNWIVRTFQGAANILSGSSQYFLGQAFKCSKNHYYHTVQSKAHIERGIRVFRQGVWEFAPGATGIALGIWVGSHLTSRYSKI